MIQLEDAKKCFELQYECTGEPELKKYVEKLDNSLEEKNLRYPKKNNLSTEKLTRDTTLEILKKTEENVRKYLFGVYDNDVQEIWSRFPHHKKSVDDIRQKNENSMTPPEEKSPIQHLMMGQLSDIMINSNNQRKSDRDDKCKKCGEKYYKKDKIFFQNKENTETKNKTLIICKNKQCFETQGGLHKNISEELVSLFKLLTSVRNILTHAEEEDLKKDQMSWEIRFNSVAGDCRLVNYFLEKITHSLISNTTLWMSYFILHDNFTSKELSSSTFPMSTHVS
jgi:ribosome-binding ATPase YchF (GTP1/OBG family)